MPFTGYRVYRGVGGLGNVDFSSAVGSVGAGNDSIALAGLGHAAATKYTYVLRPVLSDLETPDYSCVVEVSMDASADWEGNRPAPVSGLSVEVVAGGKTRLRWSYTTPRNNTAPSGFSIWHGSSLPVDTSGAADATETYAADGTYSKDITLTDGATTYFAVTAFSASVVHSALAVVGPVVADDTDPAAPTIYTGSTY